MDVLTDPSNGIVAGQHGNEIHARELPEQRLERALEVDAWRTKENRSSVEPISH